MSRRPTRSPLAAPSALAAALATLLAACGSAAEPEAGAAPSPEALPFAFAARSDTPYVTGRVVAREERAGAPVRIRVQARAGVEPSQARVPEAVVAVHPDSLLRWRDGSAARPADLAVGRAVVVWVRGPEMRSLPPQVTGSAILVER